MVRLTVTHDELQAGSGMDKGVRHGWPVVLSSLKSLLETGESLNLRIPDEVVERWRAEKATA
jgi:hypothetical protein